MAYILKQVDQIEKGKPGELSKKDLVNLLINLSDAEKNLLSKEFIQVYELFEFYQRDTQRISMDFIKYLECSKEIIDEFNLIAPYEKYSGARENDAQHMVKEIDDSRTLIKANGLVTAVRVSIGDVFYNLEGQKGAISAIIAVSAALKYYLEKYNVDVYN